MSDKLEEFVSLARSKVGTDNTWTCNVTEFDKSGQWCAAFVWACAKTVGIDDVLIYSSSGASSMVYYSTKKGFGNWLLGPAQGKHPVPQVGDLYTKAGTPPSGIPEIYGSKHVGIVVSVSESESSYTTVDGNYKDSASGDERSLVRLSKYSFSNSSIRGFFRPNWSAVGASASYTQYGSNLIGGVGTQQYLSQFQPTDSMLRQVSYMTDSGDPSLSNSQMLLSVVNYTPMLSSLVGSVLSSQANTQAAVGGASGYPIEMQSSIHTRSGAVVTEGTSVVIPTSVSQTGIISNYTSYSYYYGRWSRGTVQEKLSIIWGQKGKPSAYGVATLDGYYLVALSPKFGNTGDVVTVVLEDGTTFNAILGDMKGSDARSPWGHTFGNAVDIVEWEAVGPEDNRHVDHPALTRSLKDAGFYGKKVSKIVNYGSWING